jgi:hypothetical protein
LEHDNGELDSLPELLRSRSEPQSSAGDRSLWLQRKFGHVDTGDILPGSGGGWSYADYRWIWNIDLTEWRHGSSDDQLDGRRRERRAVQPIDDRILHGELVNSDERWLQF